MTQEFSIIMKHGLKELDISLSEYQIDQFYKYYELLIDWNKVMNLTTITELTEVVQKHFIDSLSIVKALDIENCNNLIDVGSGAGFPGIPIKIVYPKLKVTLLDSLNKRIRFLDEVIIRLELIDIIAVHGRAEDIGRDAAHREQYDLCVSRAVANLSVLSEYCIPFVKIGGYFIPYKSGKIEDEKAEAKGAVYKLGSEIEDCIAFQLPDTKMDRSLILIKKKSVINKKYPRKAGIPGKEPL